MGNPNVRVVPTRPRELARRRWRWGLAVAALATVVVASSCSSDHGGMAMDPGSGSAMPGMDGHGADGSGGTAIEVPADAGFNAADVAFAQGMIVHHGQAIAMADLALATSGDPEVLALAEQIKAAQDPEIRTMAGWLAAWGYDAPDPMGGAGDGHGSDGTMAGMAMDGMMSDQEMADLGASTGTDFDRLFLAMMIRHHEGAVAMAEQLQAEGEDPRGQELAGAIIAAQQAEIATMEAMLAALPAS